MLQRDPKAVNGRNVIGWRLGPSLWPPAIPSNAHCSSLATWIPKPPGSMNQYGSEGPWFAANAETGLPCDNPLLYQEVKEDLEAARDHRMSAWRNNRGETVYYTFGGVTVIYTVVLPVTEMGSGCDWQATYVSHAGTVLWFYMGFARRTLRMHSSSTFTVYPP